MNNYTFWVNAEDMDSHARNLLGFGENITIQRGHVLEAIFMAMMDKKDNIFCKHDDFRCRAYRREVRWFSRTEYEVCSASLLLESRITSDFVLELDLQASDPIAQKLEKYLTLHGLIFKIDTETVIKTPHPLSKL